MVTWHHAGNWSGGRAPARRHAGDGSGGKPLPAMAQAAGGLFCQTFSEVVLFDNTLAQVV
jgi:hypothetical protein